MPGTSLNWTSGGDTTISGSRRATSGKPRSGQTGGLFEPLVMFFGLTNSPATFQTMMNDIFADLIGEGVVCVYMDDILVFAETREELSRVTRIVLERLRKHKLYLKAEKCEFEREQIEYLGLIISHNKVAMDPVKGSSG